MAFVVVVHLSPEHESHIAELIQRGCALPVKQVTDGLKIEANHVYVIPPKSSLVMQDGTLGLSPFPAGPNQRMTIDRFFLTLADAHLQRSVAIVLSGTGSDGSHGIRHVKAQGGVTFAQAPEEAEYGTMPRNAIATGSVDFVLAAREIPAKLQAIWRNAQSINLPALEDQPTAEDTLAQAEDALREVIALVRTRTGHDFSHYKRATLLRRIERRLQVNQLRDLAAYRDFLREHADESRHLLADLLISVTSFFRDPETMDAIARTVVPALLEGREQGGAVRVWVVGCATGEEAYTFAMLLTEAAERKGAPTQVTVFATDIDEEALAFARVGHYPAGIRDQVSAERLRRFFVPDDDGYRVQKSLREMVMFATHNIVQDPPFSKLDCIACRNVLIYLDRHAQGKVVDLLHFALRPEGYLVLGMSESVDDRNDGFVVVDKAHRIYQQEPRRRGLMLASLPAFTPTGAAAGPPAPSPARRLVSYGELHYGLLEHYAPPSVVVDERGDVVHLSEHAGRFLQLRAGEPSFNLMRVVPDETRFELRAMFDQAMQTMRTVEREFVFPRASAPASHVTVTMHPVRDRTTAKAVVLVIFNEEAQPASRPAPPPPLPPDAVASRLEEKLQDTQSQLRAVIEQYEVQNEELKASNEELQATNEELRAATEELETGKEELQSINEELVTVNQELKNKVDEATRISDDLQNFIVSTEIAVLFVDRSLRLMRFTPFARQIFNVIPSDVGRALLDLRHRLEGVALEEDIASVFSSLRVVERECRTEDGHWYIMRILPYRTTEDRISGAVLTFVDITRRREAEEAGKRHLAWLRLIVDSVAEYAILTLDDAGRIQSWNRGAEMLFGYRADEVAGRDFAMLFLPEDAADGTPANELRTAREAGRAEDERWQLRKDGSRFFANGLTAPLLEGTAPGYVKLLRDLTEKQLAIQRREALLASEMASREAAERANRLKDEFLATLSHELRNPLALILMQSEILLRASELRGHRRLTDAVETIHQMVRAQAQFVDDMLDVSRARTGKLRIERNTVALREVVAESIGALRRDAEQSGIALEVNLPDEPMLMEADGVRLKQVAWNLLSNALKFTPSGGSVHVRLEREGEVARLDVQDSGEGLAPELLPRVFDWFRQADTGSRRRKGGMGIGLALVKQLVELHGGRVEAFSEGPGRGARFTVRLPLSASQRKSPLPAPPEPVRQDESRLSGIRLLVVDDAPGNAESLRMLLSMEGADAHMETRPSEAIKRLEADPFDVLISDLSMPDIDGYELLRRMRTTAMNARTVAIAYSGYSGPDEEKRTRDAGFVLHLTKPVDVNRMIAAIRDNVRR